MNIFRQLQTSDLLTLTKTQLTQLAELIYDTDPFIYPAAFGSKANAVQIMHEVILRNEDAMLAVRNFFVAQSCQGDMIGLILWHKGPLVWTRDQILAVAREKKIALPASLKIACDEYFCSYADTDSETIAVINVCVSQKHRGNGIGGEMMGAFCQAMKECEMELFTLADNAAAIRMYEANGFKIVEETVGFSVDTVKPACLIMKKK